MKPKQIISIIIGASVCLSLVRVTVLFAESWASVRSERAGDAALLQICEEQTLAASDKFRNACLAARADSAAPIFLKTLMRAVHTAFMDFSEAFGTPTRLCLLVLFLLSGVSAPIVKAVVTTLLRGATARDDDYTVDHESTRIILMPPEFHDKASPWARLRQRVRRHSTPRVEEAESDDDFHECGKDPADAAGWAPLHMLSSGRGRVKNKHL
jgi:hypothetical protein